MSLLWKINVILVYVGLKLIGIIIFRTSEQILSRKMEKQIFSQY